MLGTVTGKARGGAKESERECTASVLYHDKLQKGKKEVITMKWLAGWKEEEERKNRRKYLNGNCYLRRLAKLPVSGT